jgi:5'-methylthioadenosine phosphorylase
MAHPVSPRLRIHLASAAMAEGIAVVRGRHLTSAWKVPQFSTLAESLTYKQLGYSVIGMTNMPEAKLAREGRDLLRDRCDGHRFRLLASPTTTP